MTKQRIAEVFVDLADTLTDDFDVVDLLQSLTEHCVELLEASAAGLMLADQNGRLQLVAGTSTATRALELFELHQDEGPGVDTYTSGQSILNITIASEVAAQRWPTFTPAALQAGVRSTSALPMRLRGRVMGTLSLFSDRHDSLTQTSLALGQAMADIATIGLLNQRTLREKTLLEEQLQAALLSRVVIEQAKGVLAARAGISVQEAFTQLRQHARRHGAPLREVAESVVTGELRLDAHGHPAAGSAAPTSPAGEARKLLPPLDLQVLRMIAAGTAAAVVSRRLRITVADVAQHLLTVRTHLGVDSTAAAVQTARRHGLL